MKAKISSLLISRIIRLALKQHEETRSFLGTPKQHLTTSLLLQIGKNVLIKQRNSCDSFSDSH